jgi:hypothetical protein
LAIFRFEVGSKYANGPNSIRNWPRIDQNGVRAMNTRLKKNSRSWAKRSAKIDIGIDKATFDLPLRTKSEANCSEPWPVRHRRHTEQKRLVGTFLNPHRGLFRLPCRVVLTRYAPHELDAFDNLPASFKYIVDAICAIITGNYVAGRADGDKRINISCGQVKSLEYGIRIEISWDLENKNT